MKQAQEHLRQEWLRLAAQWRFADSQWQDLLRHRFEREYMQLYEPTVSSTLNAMQKLDKLIEQAKRELRSL